METEDLKVPGSSPGFGNGILVGSSWLFCRAALSSPSLHQPWLHPTPQLGGAARTQLAGAHPCSAPSHPALLDVSVAKGGVWCYHGGSRIA